MKQRLTPHYDHKKLDDPSCADLMDVFEDAWKGYIRKPPPWASAFALVRNRTGPLCMNTFGW